MQVYGYVKVNSEGGRNGKEADVVICDTRQERDKLMYQDYAETFDTIEADHGFDMDENGPHDENGEYKMTEEEFMEEIRNSDNENQSVFGLIQMPDYHIQFEPFCKIS